MSFFVPIPCAMFLPISLHGISVSSFNLFSQLALHPGSLCVFNASVMSLTLTVIWSIVVSFLVYFLVSILLGSGSCILPVPVYIPPFHVATFLIFLFCYFSGFSSCYGESSWAELSHMYSYFLVFDVVFCSHYAYFNVVFFSFYCYRNIFPFLFSSFASSVASTILYRYIDVG